MRFAVMMLIILTTSFALVPVHAESTGKIKGRILDLFGNPIVGAEILISTNGKVDQRLTTDQNGRYEGGGFQAATYSIAASLLGFHTAKRSVYVGPGEQVVIELGLRPGRLGPVGEEAIVAGTVRRLDGSEVGGATVTIMNAFNDEIREQTLASSTGRFELKIAEPGQYIIYASGPGFGVDARGITIPTRFPKEPLVVVLKLRLLK